eukprot:3471079-Rhodomonas_salina.1
MALLALSSVARYAPESNTSERTMPRRYKRMTLRAPYATSGTETAYGSDAYARCSTERLHPAVFKGAPA